MGNITELIPLLSFQYSFDEDNDDSSPTKTSCASSLNFSGKRDNFVDEGFKGGGGEINLLDVIEEIYAFCGCVSPLSEDFSLSLSFRL